ncbi:cell division protein FtsL [Enterococcus villorum]|jgi:cell division protein FtsL|uniref:Cell division protein FtsL n=2 Tax=Enterococcus villorum TaxID=112904 RepID=A0A1V8YW43_9ENTE|nr:cell division protein FtsL [Enterococcus villorum]EOH89303.1 cell division protein FtsL [Enterococcus villorum ATCC 700913]EOW76111.1 cell division protein FtsL [Enterococcus villorum ATCC 700913]OQO70980.1 cell division protein FtsL [Enterococcus villorum]OQO76819.1 cell division protein FtsL [Enterococcus villorum]GEL91165.1 cell division protein FtsL [Enterococcus villorum]
MAELRKVQEYPYDLPDLVDQPEQQLPEPEQEVHLPQSPAKRLKHISNLEKIAVVSIIFSVVALCVLTVMLRTNISGVEKSITTIQTEINNKTKDKTSLVQEKNELSRTERIKKIAEEKGLSINDDNLRKVK